MDNQVDKLLAAIAAVRDGCTTVPKSGRNTFHNYDYATEADIQKHVLPLMAKHGLLLIPSLAKTEDGFPAPRIDEHGVTQMVMAFTLAHTSGQVWPEKIYTLAHGNDRDSKGGYSDKGAYKASTGGFKYTLMRLFMIPTGDDPENHGTQGGSTTATASAPSGGRPRTAAGGAVRLASDKQIGMLKARSYTRAETLTEQDSNHEAAHSIRNAALKFLGIGSADDIPMDAVDGLVRAIESAELDDKGHAVIPASDASF